MYSPPFEGGTEGGLKMFPSPRCFTPTPYPMGRSEIGAPRGTLSTREWDYHIRRRIPFLDGVSTPVE